MSKVYAGQGGTARNCGMRNKWKNHIIYLGTWFQLQKRCALLVSRFFVNQTFDAVI